MVGNQQIDGLGQAEGVPRRRGSGLLHACRRAARPVAIGGVAPGLGARRRIVGVAVPPPRARADPHRTGRIALSHRARSVHEARGGAHQAHRQPRTAERRIEGVDHAGHRRALAHAAARRIPRSLSRHPHHADHHRRRTRSRHARGRRRHPPAPADPAGPDSAQIVLGAFPRLCLAGLSQAFRHAAHA